MTVVSVTTAEGANATIPDATSFPVVTSNDGGMPIVSLGYVDGSNEAQPLGDANGIPVSGTTSIEGLTVDAASATVNVGDATSSTELIAANSARIGWSLTNMSSAVLYVKLGSGASATSFHKRLEQYQDCGQGLFDGLYRGAIYGIWASDAGGTVVGGDW